VDCGPSDLAGLLKQFRVDGLAGECGEDDCRGEQRLFHISIDSIQD